MKYLIAVISFNHKLEE